MKHNGIKQISSILMLFVLVSYMVFITVFSHVHFVGKYSVIHAHPFTSESHNHSAAECYTIAGLSIFYGSAISSLTLLEPYFQIFYIPFVEYECDVVHAPRFYKSFRAPPFI